VRSLNSRKTLSTLIRTNIIALSILFAIGLTLFMSAHFLTSGGEVPFDLKLDAANIAIAFLSCTMILLYGYYTKKKYLYIFAFGLFFGSVVEYQNNLFNIDGQIDATFLGFYFLVMILVVFILIAKLTYRIIRINVDLLVLLTILILLLYVYLKTYVLEESIIIENGMTYILELVMLSAVPFFFGWYYNTFSTRKNTMNFSIYLGSFTYFTSMICYSLFLAGNDHRFLFTAVLMETLTFGLYLIFVPIAFYEIIREKDEAIKKSEVLKKNLFMFFKSAEYNENITVFVNSKHRILYSNSKYKIFFNHYGEFLDDEMSNYLAEKYEVIKYNMNYSSSMKFKLGENTFILDVDVVYIEQDDEEIFCITAKDITVIRAMQESLERSEYKYRSFFNLIPDFIFLYDLVRKRVVEANDIVYNDFRNLPNVKPVNIPVDERFMGMSFKELDEIGEKISTSEILKLETRKIKDHKGQDIYVEPNVRLIGVESNKKQMLVFLRNVTSTIKLHELRIENEANIRKLYIAEENEKMFNEFFANMSHELRTPINIILSALDMMDISEYEKEKSEKYAGLIRLNSYRLMRIVSNILDITKVDSGFYTLHMINQDIVSFTEDTVMSVLHYAEGKGLKIIFDTEVEEHLVAFDLQSLERVLLNLLSNAIKFTKKGGSILVNLSLDEKKSKVYIDVEDTGIGISKENVDHIFDRFIQVNKSMTRDTEGTGIGLSIVKKLMNLMEGDCIVSSELNEGTIFRLILKDELANDADEVALEKDFYEKTSNRVDIEFSDIPNAER